MLRETNRIIRVKDRLIDIKLIQIVFLLPHFNCQPDCIYPKENPIVSIWRDSDSLDVNCNVRDAAEYDILSARYIITKSAPHRKVGLWL